MAGITPNCASHNMTHMYDFHDLRSTQKKIIYSPRSIMGIINNNPNFSRFNYMLKLAKLDSIYNDIQANFTLFVTDDKSLSHISEAVFTNMDVLLARHIIQKSTLKNKITAELLKGSPVSYFSTMNRAEKLYITNVDNQTYINSSIKIIDTDLEANNGIIHIVNNLII
jgi:hypothetical protein